jgi:hypothetical protein
MLIILLLFCLNGPWVFNVNIVSLLPALFDPVAIFTPILFRPYSIIIIHCATHSRTSPLEIPILSWEACGARVTRRCLLLTLPLSLRVMIEGRLKEIEREVKARVYAHTRCIPARNRTMAAITLLFITIIRSFQTSLYTLSSWSASCCVSQ